MANSLGIDFSPQPAYGSNPFEPVQQGISLGFGIQNQLQQQKQNQQEMELKKQQAMQQMKLQDFDCGIKAFSLLADKGFSSKLSDSSKEKILQGAIPLPNSSLGLNLNQSDISLKHIEHDDLTRISDLITQSANPVTGVLRNPDILKNEINQLMIKANRSGDTEQFNLLDKLAGNIDKSTTAKDLRGERLDAGKLRIEFLNRPEVKDYVTTNTQVKSMDKLLSSGLAGNNENKVALDQALISMFNKLTDPQSVVRE